MSSVIPWLTSGIVEVLLPSGSRIKGVLPSMRALQRRDLLEPALYPAATHFGDSEWVGDDPDRKRAVQAVLDRLVAAFPRQTRPPDSDVWTDVRLSGDDVTALPDRDRDLLEDIVLRLRTTDEVTTLSEQLLASDGEAT